MSDDDRDSEEILRRLREDALHAAAESSRSMGEEAFDLVDLARGGAAEREAEDRTLGGYIGTHDRPPAFEGSDGEPYTVAVEVEETGEPDRPFVAFLVFVRWAATGAGIMGHVESDDVASGGSEAAAREAALRLSLHDVKAALDRAIERRRKDMME